MMNNYLNILEESLVKKIGILDQLQVLCDEQETILKTEPMDLEEFDKRVDAKDTLIKELTKMDEGFDTLYENIKKELLENKDKYAEQIKILQRLIQEVMDKSVSIQAREKRNKDMVFAYFKKERQSFAENRKVSRAAYDYYKNMSNPGAVSSQFMDQKK